MARLLCSLCSNVRLEHKNGARTQAAKMIGQHQKKTDIDKLTKLTSLTNEEVCRLSNVGRMIWIVVGIPKLAVPLINTIGKTHQYIGGYLNETHVSSNLRFFFVSDRSRLNKISVNLP